MRAHAELAELVGVPAQRVLLAEDGVVIDLVDGVASIVGKVDCGYVFVDGSSVGDITESDLKDRRILGEDRATGCFAMAYLPPERYPIWKALLRDGAIEPATAERVGAVLGQMKPMASAPPTTAAAIASHIRRRRQRYDARIRFTLASG